jgi:hypothetical protein
MASRLVARLLTAAPTKFAPVGGYLNRLWIAGEFEALSEPPAMAGGTGLHWQAVRAAEPIGSRPLLTGF